MDTAKTGAYLASLRKAAGMTQQDAADRLGVSNKTVSKWESGGGFPDITVLPALAELYGVTADDILAGEPVRPGSGGGRVEQYLARRGELRWRIGFSAAALFLLAAIVFQGYVWSWLLAAGGAAAIWIGWGRCGGEEIRRRLVLLLPWAVGLVWYVLCYFQWALRLATALTEDYANGYSVIYYLAYMLRWDMLLVLLAAVYGLLRAAAVRAGLSAEPALLAGHGHPVADLAGGGDRPLDRDAAAHAGVCRHDPLLRHQDLSGAVG